MALMEDPNVPMGAQPPTGQPMGAGAPMEADDAVLDMHLTDDVKRALQAMLALWLTEAPENL